MKPWLWIQNLLSPFCERLCFIWCPVHYCQHIWKVLSLETSPILFQAGLNISRQEAENETFPQETACSAFYLVQQSEGLILCKTHLNKQLYIYPPHLWDFYFFFFLFFIHLVVQKIGGGGRCKETVYMEFPLVLRLQQFISAPTPGTVSIHRPITQGVLSPPQEQKHILGKEELPLRYNQSKQQQAGGKKKKQANQIDTWITSSFFKSYPGLVRLICVLAHVCATDPSAGSCLLKFCLLTDLREFDGASALWGACWQNIHELGVAQWGKFLRKL